MQLLRVCPSPPTSCARSRAWRSVRRWPMFLPMPASIRGAPPWLTLSMQFAPAAIGPDRHRHIRDSGCSRGPLPRRVRREWARRKPCSKLVESASRIEGALRPASNLNTLNVFSSFERRWFSTGYLAFCRAAAGVFDISTAPNTAMTDSSKNEGEIYVRKGCGQLSRIYTTRSQCTPPSLVR